MAGVFFFFSYDRKEKIWCKVILETAASFSDKFISVDLLTREKPVRTYWSQLYITGSKFFFLTLGWREKKWLNFCALNGFLTCSQTVPSLWNNFYNFSYFSSVLLGVNCARSPSWRHKDGRTSRRFYKPRDLKQKCVENKISWSFIFNSLFENTELKRLTNCGRGFTELLSCQVFKPRVVNYGIV